MPPRDGEEERTERLVRQFVDDERISANVIRGLLRSLDQEMQRLTDAGTKVPKPLRECREILARAFILREEKERLRALEGAGPPAR